MKIFRLWGLATFLVISGLVVAFWLLFAESVTKASIEFVGSRAANAKVEIDSVDLNFDPLSFDIKGIQVADSEDPWTNLVEIEHTKAEVNLWRLLAGKTYISEVAISKVELGTKRDSSGALEKVAKEESGSDSDSEDSEPGLTDKSKDFLKDKAKDASGKLPDVDDLLEREPLKTDLAAKDLEAYWTQAEKDFNSQLKQVPDQQAFNNYQAELKKIVDTDIKSLKEFEQRKKQFNELKKNFDTDKKVIDEFQKLTNTQRKELETKIEALKKAPNEDLNNLKSKYKLDAEGAGNISQLLFGDSAGEWTDEALKWYGKIKPYLPKEGGSEGESEASDAQTVNEERIGRWIHFPGREPIPEFLIAELSGSVITGERTFKLAAQDITTEQPVIQRKTQFQLTNEFKKERIALVGEVDMLSKQASVPFTLEAKNLKVNEYGLVSSDQMSILLESAILNTKGTGNLTVDNFQTKITNRFTRANFNSTGKTTFAKELGKALDTIKDFDAVITTKGNPVKPGIGIRSNLDKKISGAFNQRIAEERKAFETKLKNKLEARKKALLKPYEDKLAQLNSKQQELDNKKKELQQMANSKLVDFEAQQKAKAKKEAEEAKRKAKAEADRKKKEAEEKAKKELEKKKKELEKKLKDFKI